MNYSLTARDECVCILTRSSEILAINRESTHRQVKTCYGLLATGIESSGYNRLCRFRPRCYSSALQRQA